MSAHPSHSLQFVCKWTPCPARAFFTEKELYQHVVAHHVGSNGKKGGNITKCHWNSCGKEVTAKRHHLISHVKVHLDYKPYTCHCGKSFKRSHDKNKHMRVHTPRQQQVHQQQQQVQMHAPAPAASQSMVIIQAQ